MPNATKKTGDAPKELSAEEKRNLDVEINFMEGLTRRDPYYVEALSVLASDYTCRERYQEGLRLDERLAVLRPEDPIVHYNLACSLSLTHQLDAAIETLKKAVTLGYADFDAMAEDPDLENVRQHPEFKKVRARARRPHVRES